MPRSRPLDLSLSHTATQACERPGHSRSDRLSVSEYAALGLPESPLPISGWTFGLRDAVPDAGATITGDARRRGAPLFGYRRPIPLNLLNLLREFRASQALFKGVFTRNPPCETQIPPRYS